MSGETAGPDTGGRRAEPAAAPAAAPRLGLVVNPVAGIGGAVGLHGSDGAETVARAIALGAVPHAVERAAAALAALAAAWPPEREPPVLLTGAGPMGEASARAAGIAPEVIDGVGGDGATAPSSAAAPGTARGPATPTDPGTPASTPPTTAADTRRLAGRLAEAGVELLLVAGGDGTARDVAAAVGPRLPVLGIPAGVKIQSAVYATSPHAAGELAAAFLATERERRRTSPRELLDLDDAALGGGRVAPRLYGELAVPAGDRRVQARKEPSPLGESAATAAIADELARRLPLGERLILGPGSTVAALERRLGLAPSLVGVDLAEMTGPGTARLLAADAGETELLAAAGDGDATVVVTPIGGQGFLLGRGNQQLGPALVRAVLARRGRDAFVVVATAEKLAALRGRPLLVDTGDPALDAALAGHLRIVTGHGERTIYAVAPA